MPEPNEPGVLCPVHATEFRPVESRSFDVYGQYRFPARLMLVTKSVCLTPGCTETVFCDQMGVVIEGVHRFPKRQLIWKAEDA